MQISQISMGIAVKGMVTRVGAMRILNGSSGMVLQTKMEFSKLVSTVHNAAVELMVLQTSTMCSLIQQTENLSMEIYLKNKFHFHTSCTYLKQC